MGIIGNNGAGKSTFFDYIMNENKRYTGEFLLNGKNIHKDHVSTLNKIGFITEDRYFLEYETALGNAKMFGRFYSDFDIELFKSTMKEFNLSTGKSVGSMSRGEYMKFQMAFTIAYKPILYLIDEATAGMDPVFRVDFYNKLRNLIMDEKCSVIMSTHIEEEIDKEFDYIGIIEEGCLVSFKENME